MTKPRRQIVRLAAAPMLPLAIDGDNGAPSWVRLMPAGRIVPADGRGPWRLDDMDAVIAASVAGAAGGILPIDYDHQSETVAERGGSARAAGWIVELAVRPGPDGGIWGRVEWTEAGRAAIAAREYRFLSPTFEVATKAGRVLRLLRAGLTNTPAIHELQLAAHHPTRTTTPEPDMPDIAKLAAALGLAEDADAQEVVAAAVKAIADKETAVAEAKAEADKAKETAAASKPDPSHYVPRAALDDLTREVASLRQAQASEAATRAVAAASAAGKLAPALSDWALDYATRDPAGFAGWAEKAPTIVAARAGGGAGARASAQPPELPADETGLDADALAVCRATGVSPTQFLETARAKRAAETARAARGG